MECDNHNNHGVDYEHRFELLTSNATGSLPPSYVPIEVARTKRGRQPTDENLKLEMRFCYASRIIKLVLSDQEKHRRNADGGLLMWEWDLHDLWRANIGTAEANHACEVSLCFCARPSFHARRYELGQRQWRPESPPRFLASLISHPVLRITCDHLKIRSALQKLHETNSLFEVTTATAEINDCETSEDGYDSALLLLACKNATERILAENDNQSDLIRALRMETSERKTDMLSHITSKCRLIMTVALDPTYTHPMPCCCCGRMTHIHLTTGVRVLSSSNKSHYVCTFFVPYVEQLDRLRRYKRFNQFKKLLLIIHRKLNPTF